MIGTRLTNKEMSAFGITPAQKNGIVWVIDMNIIKTNSVLIIPLKEF
jgi:hypothetical protein